MIHTRYQKLTVIRGQNSLLQILPIEVGKVEAVAGFFSSWAPKSLWMVTAAVKLKDALLLGRKVMTILESMLKSKDITLPTEVHIVKAMSFLLVMYECESWTMRKAECQGTDASKLWMLEKTCESPLDSKEIKPVNPKENQP